STGLPLRVQLTGPAHTLVPHPPRPVTLLDQNAFDGLRGPQPERVADGLVHHHSSSRISVTPPDSRQSDLDRNRPSRRATSPVPVEVSSGGSNAERPVTRRSTASSCGATESFEATSIPMLAALPMAGSWATPGIS